MNRTPANAYGEKIKSGATVRRLRFAGVALFFALWAAVLGGKLFWLQVVKHKEYQEKALRQQERNIEVAPRRGVLYDRNLRELAVTVQADSVFAVPSEISDKHAMAEALSAILHVDPQDSFTTAEQMEARMNASRGYAWVARKIEPEMVERVKTLEKSGLGLKGIYFVKEPKRYYPNNEIAAQVLGYVGLDDNGLGGVEQRFEQKLHGVPGKRLAALDARHHVLSSQESQPMPGENLVLTLDENIQFMAEQALDHAMEKTQALNGTVVVEDVHTGEILALAMRPTFNPNDLKHSDPSLLRNHAVSDVYEPGSTFKLVTYSTAFERKVATPEDTIDCQGGKIVIAGRTIHDSHLGLGKMSVAQALWESSDVAAAKLALKIGADPFYESIRSFGFGAKTGIELPGETRGLLRPVKRWGASSIGSIAMGQEIGVTPVQLVAMVSAIANGGMLLPPHIVLQETMETKEGGKLHARSFHPEGQLPDPLPQGAHRAISTMTAAQMRKAMEGVVLYGTGKKAQLNGYSAGGKTGTAQKIDPATHTYSKTMHIASFAGLTPVNNPAIAVAVIMDSPKGAAYYGGDAAAPVFAEVAQQVLEYLGVPHDMPVKSAMVLAKAREGDTREGTEEPVGDLNALFAEINNLPEDDPLRGAATAAGAAAQNGASPSGMTSTEHPMMQKSEPFAAGKQPLPATAPTSTITPPHPAGSVVVETGKPIMVPNLMGLPVRKVVEQVGALGLGVQVLGSGTVKEQVPAAGTMVPAGTQVVVRCGR